MKKKPHDSFFWLSDNENGGGGQSEADVSVPGCVFLLATSFILYSSFCVSMAILPRISTDQVTYRARPSPRLERWDI